MLKHHPNEQSGAGLEALDGWTVVFDLDGTLVETAPDLHAALNHVLSLKGLAPVSLEDIRSMIGDGAKALIRKGLAQNGVTADEGEIEHALWPAFIEHYLANITRLSRPFDGVLAVLEALRAAGVGMAVCTNKAQGLADEVLKGLHLDHYFKACLGGDQASAPKPDG
ncbi:MAG: HAD hydrolase-like protein, partial [Pseudomonadota bacterium]